MLSHFRSQNWGYRIGILEEHPNLLPRCERCRIEFPVGILNTGNYTSKKCNQEEERRLRRGTMQRCFEASKVSFQINKETRTLSEDFTYPGQTISYNNRSWAAVYQNLRKSQRRWGMVERVLERTGATLRAW